MVEPHVANVAVAGSSPVSRSINAGPLWPALSFLALAEGGRVGEPELPDVLDDEVIGEERTFPGLHAAPLLELFGVVGGAGVVGLLAGFWGLDLVRWIRGDGFSGASVVLSVLLGLVIGLPALTAWHLGGKLRRVRDQRPLARSWRRLLAVLVGLAGLGAALWQGLPGVS